MATNKVFLLIGLLAIVLLVISEVAAQTSTTNSELIQDKEAGTTKLEDAKFGGYPGGGYGGRGGYPGGGYRGRGGYPGGGSRGGYGGSRGGYGGSRGRTCRFGCCYRGYRGCYRCCRTAAEATKMHVEIKPQN